MHIHHLRNVFRVSYSIHLSAHSFLFSFSNVIIYVSFVVSVNNTRAIYEYNCNCIISFSTNFSSDIWHGIGAYSQDRYWRLPNCILLIFDMATLIPLCSCGKTLIVFPNLGGVYIISRPKLLQATAIPHFPSWIRHLTMRTTGT